MAFLPLVLIKGPLELELRKFNSGKVQRIKPRPKLSRGTYGTPGLDGQIFYAHLWEIECEATDAQREVLEKMILLADSDRSAIRLYDYITPMREVGGRTRAIAPNSSPETADGIVSYSAQFDVFPVEDLGVSQRGRNWNLQFVLEELWPVPVSEDPA